MRAFDSLKKAMNRRSIFRSALASSPAARVSAKIAGIPKMNARFRVELDGSIRNW